MVNAKVKTLVEEPYRNASKLLIQFAKRPVRGRVKTRLAHSLGDDIALSAHIELMQATSSRLLSSALGPVQLWWDSDVLEDASEGRVCDYLRSAENRLQFLTQPQGDLGVRMLAALHAGLDRYEKVVLVGSDCPVLTEAYLEEAFAALEEADVVLGPAEDGGYVLIGARRLAELDLTGVVWGEGQVLQQTREALRKAELTLVELATLWDVDVARDYQRWKTLLDARA